MNCCLGWNCGSKSENFRLRGFETLAAGSVWICVWADLEGCKCMPTCCAISANSCWLAWNAIGSCTFVRVESDSAVIAFSDRDVGFTFEICGDTGDISTSCSFVVEAIAVFLLGSKICAFLEFWWIVKVLPFSPTWRAWPYRRRSSFLLLVPLFSCALPRRPLLVEVNS